MPGVRTGASFFLAWLLFWGSRSSCKAFLLLPRIKHSSLSSYSPLPPLPIRSSLAMVGYPEQTAVTVETGPFLEKNIRCNESRVSVNGNRERAMKLMNGIGKMTKSTIGTILCFLKDCVTIDDEDIAILIRGYDVGK